MHILNQNRLRHHVHDTHCIVQSDSSLLYFTYLPYFTYLTVSDRSVVFCTLVMYCGVLASSRCHHFQHLSVCLILLLIVTTQLRKDKCYQ